MHKNQNMLIIRNSVQSDFDTILSISADADKFDQAERSLCKSELNDWANSPHTSFSQDFFMAEINGSPIGFIGLEIQPGRMSINRIFLRGAVLPSFRRAGVGGSLMKAAENRAQEVALLFNNDLNVTIDVLCRSSQHENIALCKAFGMERVREFSTYQFDLKNLLEPLPSTLDEGVSFGAFNLEKDNIAMREIVNETFKNYWSFEPIDEQQWMHEFTSLPYFNPDHWVLASYQNEIAGFSINFIDTEYINCRSRREGYISLVGVKDNWRNRGIGKSLVCYSLSVFRKNGMESVYLYVDQNDHKYIADMYEKIGFRPMHLSLIYRKSLKHL